MGGIHFLEQRGDARLCAFAAPLSDGDGGRLNTTVNSFVFLAMFLGQWLVGLVLELWPRSGAGYAPQAYHWGLGALWLLQLAGLAWFWRGRRLFANW